MNAHLEASTDPVTKVADQQPSELMAPSENQIACERLASEIAELIRPHTTGPTEPPYKLSKLIVMGAASINKAFYRAQVFEWIVRTFP